MSMLQLYQKNPFKEIMKSFFEEPFYYEMDDSAKFITEDENYKIYLPVPGLKKDDIKTSVTRNGGLSISYKKENTDNKNYFFVSSFEKFYSIPEDVDEKDISGKVENGILEVILPRTKNKISSHRLIELK